MYLDRSQGNPCQHARSRNLLTRIGCTGKALMKISMGRRFCVLLPLTFSRALGVIFLKQFVISA